MEEREFFDERPEKKMATLNCPHCHQPAEYEVTWIVRTKKTTACPDAPTNAIAPASPRPAPTCCARTT